MSANPRFEVKIDWIDEVDGEPATTFAAISVYLDNVIFWPAEGDSPEGASLEWYADQLLSHLVKYWKRLVLEQNYPIHIQPVAPSNAWSCARARWSELPREIVLEEEDRLMAFDKAHNLANAFGGIFELGCFWVFREYNDITIDNGIQSKHIPYEIVVNALSIAGDRIADRLSKVGSGKWDAIIERWKGRDHGDSLQMLKLATNISPSTLESLVNQRLLPLNDNVMEAAKETEVKVAARMAGALPADAIVEVIQAVLTCQSVDAQVLDEWSEAVMARLNTNDMAYTYEQGVTAADAMREILGIEDCVRVDPFALFDQAGVVCYEMDLYPDVDAVACWGPSHGPAVVINRSAKRLKTNRIAVMRNSAQARVTAAHELCHLLLDRNHMVSTVEVLGGRTPIAIEQRARAFAPAFLLPKSQARKAWDEEGQPTDQAALDRLLRSLCGRFGVTRIVASWKIEHGIGNAAKLPIVHATLNQLLPSRMGSGV